MNLDKILEDLVIVCYEDPSAVGILREEIAQAKAQLIQWVSTEVIGEDEPTEANLRGSAAIASRNRRINQRNDLKATQRLRLGGE